ncbi:MAG: Omp28-related outer membrane protein [Bacteroidales bacterium]|nr:Omp28-related outer membrane protein [Bacteroidales bacterium]
MKKIVSFLAAAAMMGFGIASAQTRFVSEEPQSRKALLEEYTGIHCGFCPDGHARANALLEQYPDDLFIMNIHAGSYADPNPGEVDLRTEYGEALVSNAGVGGFPAGSVSRHIFSGKNTATDRGSWATNVPKILAMASPVNIAAKGTLDWENRTLSVTVQVYYTANSAAATNYIHVAVTQDNIVGTQAGASYNPAQVLPGGKYIHHHAFRDFLTGQWGDAVTTTTQGSFVEKTYTKTLPETIKNVNLNLIDLHFIAFVTESHNEVLNACKVEMEHKNSPNHYIKLSNMKQALDNTCDNNIRFSYRLETAIASEPITSIVFNYETPSGTQEFEYKPEEALTANKTYSLETAPIAVTQRGVNQNVSMKIAKINGKDYSFETNNLVEADGIKLLALTPTHDINVNIWQDKYGSDITWQLQEIGGSVLASGGPYPDLSGNTTVQRTSKATLADGCYSFTIYDKNKDGINTTYGAGHLSMTDANNQEFMTHDGKYKDSLRYLVRFSPVSNEKEQQAYHTVLAPNPANEYSMLSFELPAAQTVRVRVLANNGACVLDLGNKNLAAGKQNILMPVNQLTEGLYVIQLSGEKLNLTQKLMIVR